MFKMERGNFKEYLEAAMYSGKRRALRGRILLQGGSYILSMLAIFLLWKSEPKKRSFKEFPRSISKQPKDFMAKEITFFDGNLR